MEAKIRFIANSIIFILIFGFIYFFSEYLLIYLLPFIIGLALAYAVQKPAKRLSGITGLKCGSCAALLVSVIYIVIIAVLCLAAVLTFVQLSGLLTRFSGELARLISKISAPGDMLFGITNHLPDGNTDALRDFLNSAAGDVTGKISGFLSSLATGAAGAMPGFFISAVVTVVASCYIAKDYRVICRFLQDFLKESSYKSIVRIKNILSQSVMKFLRGYLLLMLITFAELTAGFLLLRIKYAVALAALIALIDVLPVLGTGTVLVPWAAVSAFTGKPAFAAGLAVLYIIITLVRNFSEPRIIGKQMGITPLLSLISMFLGLKLFGAAGMVLLPISLIVVIGFYRGEGGDKEEQPDLQDKESS